MNNNIKTIFISLIVLFFNFTPLNASEIYKCKETNGSELLSIKADELNTIETKPVDENKKFFQKYKELCFTDLSYHKPFTMGCLNSTTKSISYEHKLIKLIEKDSSFTKGSIKLQFSHFISESSGLTSSRSYPYFVEYKCTKEN